MTTLATPLAPKPRPLLFLRKFLKEGKRVASIAPSSKALAKSLCRHVDPLRPQVIVELGAGTGAVTKVAVQRMHPDSRLIAVEIDPQFAAILRQSCPRAQVLCCDAFDLAAQLDAMKIQSIDLLLSGLPTPSLPRRINEVVLDLFSQRATNAYFSQLTVMPWVFKPMYQKLFEEVDFDLIPANIPPGGVYHCRKLRPTYREFVPGKDLR